MIRYCISLISAVAVAIAAPSSPVMSQVPGPATPPGRIIGVFDTRTGAPLAGVQVRDAFSGTYAITTAAGMTRLDFLTFRGNAALVDLRKLGYEERQLLVSRDDTVSITELMEPVATMAPVITTEHYRIARDAGRWRGFETRCLSKGVTCIRAEDLAKKLSSNLADVLLHADGITMGSCASGRNAQCGRIAMRSTVIPPAYCQPTFFIDGFEWNARIGPPTDLSPGTPAEAPYIPANVKAIEVYRSEAPRPLRFQGDPMCGAIVIWTK